MLERFAWMKIDQRKFSIVFFVLTLLIVAWPWMCNDPYYYQIDDVTLDFVEIDNIRTRYDTIHYLYPKKYTAVERVRYYPVEKSRTINDSSRYGILITSEIELCHKPSAQAAFAATEPGGGGSFQEIKTVSLILTDLTTHSTKEVQDCFSYKDTLDLFLWKTDSPGNTQELRPVASISAFKDLFNTDWSTHSPGLRPWRFLLMTDEKCVPLFPAKFKLTLQIVFTDGTFLKAETNRCTKL
jgi:hypothetical protein